MLLVCMLSGLTIWYWITNGCALPGKNYFSHSQHSLDACSYSCRIKTSWSFPCPLWASLLLSLFSSSLGSHIGETHWCRFWDSKSIVFWLLQSFWPPFHIVPWALHAGVFYGCIHWDWAAQLCIFALLWFSLVVSICWKEVFPGWGIRTTYFFLKKKWEYRLYFILSSESNVFS